MNTGRLLDVSALEPPEPLERALAAIETLAPGEHLRLRHRREPHLLYPILAERGFDHRTVVRGEASYEVFIWRRGDAAARRAVEHLRRGER